MVNLALSNGQVVSTTLANLQSIAQPQTMMNTSTNGELVLWIQDVGFTYDSLIRLLIIVE